MSWTDILAFWLGGALATAPITYKVWGKDFESRPRLASAITGAIWPVLISEILIGLIWNAAFRTPAEEPCAEAFEDEARAAEEPTAEAPAELVTPETEEA